MINETLCVILHYGSEDCTNNCIDSLIQEDSLEIIVVDNDPSQSYSPLEKHSKLVKLIRTGGYSGFSEGNNLGVQKFLKEHHKFILILNNDTVVKKGALNYLLGVMESKDVGVVGPCLPYADYQDTVWACGGHVSKVTLSIGGRQPRSSVPYEVDYLPGAAFLCSAVLWRKIGGLNEEYFLAYEEAEFCLEIRRHGFRVMVDPRSIVLHKVGMSNQRRPEYFYNNIRNKLIFSRYIYGEIIGRVYAIAITLFSLKSSTPKSLSLRLRLWVMAVVHDLAGVPISRDLLQRVRRFAGAV